MKEANNGWGAFRKKLQHHEMPAEKGDWGGLESMLDQVPPPIPPSAPNGVSSLLGGMAGKVAGLVLVAAVGGITLWYANKESGNPISQTNTQNEQISNEQTLNEQSVINQNQINEETSTELIQDKDSETLHEEMTKEVKQPLISDANVDPEKNEHTNETLSLNTEMNTRDTELAKISDQKESKSEHLTKQADQTNKQTKRKDLPPPVKRERSNSDQKDGSIFESPNNVNSSVDPSNDLFSQNIEGKDAVAKTDQVLDKTENNTREKYENSPSTTDALNAGVSTEGTTSTGLDWTKVPLTSLPMMNLSTPLLSGSKDSIDHLVNVAAGPNGNTKVMRGFRGLTVGLYGGLVGREGSFNQGLDINPEIGIFANYRITRLHGIEVQGSFHQQRPYANRVVNYDELIDGELLRIDESDTYELVDFFKARIKYKFYIPNSKLVLGAGIGVNWYSGGRVIKNRQVYNENTMVSYNEKITFRDRGPNGQSIVNNRVQGNFRTYDGDVNLMAVAEYRLKPNIDLYTEVELQTHPIGGGADVLIHAGVKYAFVNNEKPYTRTVHKTEKRLRVSGILGAAYAGQNQYKRASGNVLGGAEVSYKLNNKIGVGIGVMYYSNSAYFSNSDSTSRTDVFSGIDVNIVSKTINDRVDYVRIPFKVFLYGNKKWNLNAGMTLHADLGIVSKSSERYYNLANGNLVNSVDHSGGSSSYYSAAPYELGLNLGAEYEVSKSLRVFAETKAIFYGSNSDILSEQRKTGFMIFAGIKQDLVKLIKF